MKNIVYIFILLITFSCKNEKEQLTDNSKTQEVNIVNYNLEVLQDAKLYSGQLIRTDSFPSKYIKPRPVDIWLPKDYSKNKKYSVLYMHDGQMLFDSTTTWNKQEWKVDE